MTKDHAEDPLVVLLKNRVGATYLRQRLGIEREKEALVFSQGLNFFHIENWYSVHSVIRAGLRMTMLLGRGRRNALRFDIVHRDIPLQGLPAAFAGYTILHLSDLHLDINDTLTHALMREVRGLDYDLCVLTGDYRAKTFGPMDNIMEHMRRLRGVLKGEVYGILGNHDSIRMVPGLEAMGIRMLLNESVTLQQQGQRIHLAGIDDPHYFRADNIEKAFEDLPEDELRVLLSHTPEVYRQAAHSGAKLYLCGHTHGGQICLPGGYPLMCNAKAPRSFCRGGWNYHRMQGYTSKGAGVSVVDVRYNCTPEITLHRLIPA